MNTNSTYAIGKEHIVCEDYALSFVDARFGNAFAIVCDGCSASPDVDFGARMLAKSAENLILTRGDDPTIMTDAYEFGSYTITTAEEIFDVLPVLHPNALDATLLVAMANKPKNTLVVFMYGDGVLVHRTNTTVHTAHINLSSGAPDYLSYHLDSARFAAYKAMENNIKQVSSTSYGTTIQVNTKPLEPYVYKNEVKEGDVIAVISDGINSFRQANNDPIPWTELVDEFTGYKNFEGQFVQRRLAAFKRKCLKDCVTHSDDISVAAIVI